MKTLIARTGERVERITSPRSRGRIERATRRSLKSTAAKGKSGIDRRLGDLDREWDIERTIEANASTLALAGTLLGIFVHRRFFALPIAVSAFLLQHALQGWCPPVPLLRRLGFRTAKEIHEERTALKALRGDFQRVRRDRTAPALRAARLGIE
jgi:hypothetical protein